jgi:DDE superfamily endonuclease
MCDSRLCFTYMSIAGTGRTNDNRAIQRLERLQKWMDDLPNGYYLIGDNAFTLSNKMLIPFRNEEHKRTYNFYLSQLRIRIEMAFGRMTTKWRIFRRPLDTSLAKARKIIAVAMMLHNYVIQEEGLVMNNLESDPCRRFGVDMLPTQDGTENNGFLPVEEAVVELEQRPNAHRRNTILREMIDLDLLRPFDNIERNG